jgi:hypothetical protein
MQSPDSRQSSAGRWVPFDQARMTLRMSEGTLRRAIRDGKVVAEQRRRNPDSPTDQRMVYEVLVTDPPASVTDSESAHPPTTSQHPPASASALSEALSAITDALDAERGERQRLAAENADLRERVGRAEAVAASATATATALQAEIARLQARPSWRAWWPW